MKKRILTAMVLCLVLLASCGTADNNSQTPNSNTNSNTDTNTDGTVNEKADSNIADDMKDAGENISDTAKDAADNMGKAAKDLTGMNNNSTAK